MSETTSEGREETKREEKKSARDSSGKSKSTPRMEIDGVTMDESSTGQDEDDVLAGASSPDLERLMMRLERTARTGAETESERARARGEAAAAHFEEGNWQWNSQYGDVLPWIVSQLDAASSVRLILKIDGQSGPVVFGAQDARRTHEIVLCRSSVAHLEHYYPDGAKPSDFPGDGDCFYRAFLHGLLGYADAGAIAELRTGVVNYIRANPVAVGEKLFGPASEQSRSILKKSGSYEQSRESGAGRNSKLVLGEIDIIEALPESLVGRRKRRLAEERKKLKILQKNFHPERTRRRLAAEYEANRLVDQALRKSRSVLQQLKDLWASFKDVMRYGGSGHRQGFEVYRNSEEAIKKIDDVLLSDKAALEIEFAGVSARHAWQRYRGAALARAVDISASRTEEAERAMLAQKDSSVITGAELIALGNKIRNARLASAEGKAEQEKIDEIRKKKKQLSAQERLDETRNVHEEAKYFYRLFAETFARDYRRRAAWLGALSLVSDAFLKLGRLQPLHDFAKDLQTRSRKREAEKAAAFFRNQEEKDAKFEEDWANQQSAYQDVFKASLEAIVEEVNEDGSVKAWDGNDDGYTEITISKPSLAETSPVSTSSAGSVVADMHAFLAPVNATADQGMSEVLFSARSADPAKTSARSPGKRTRPASVEMQVMSAAGAGIGARMLVHAIQAGGADGAAEAGIAAPLINGRQVRGNRRRERGWRNQFSRSRINALFWFAMGAIVVGAVWGIVRLMLRMFSGSIAENASSSNKEEENAGARTQEARTDPVTERLQETDANVTSAAREQDRTTRFIVPEAATVATGGSTEISGKKDDDVDDGIQGDAPIQEDEPTEDEATRHRREEMVRGLIRHEYRAGDLPVAAAGEWGTKEDGSEADTVPISRVSGTAFQFGDSANQTVVFDVKPEHARIGITVPRWTIQEEADIRDMVFFPLLKKGYSFASGTDNADPLNYRAHVVISKKGEADCTLDVSGDKEAIDRIIGNLNFAKDNLLSLESELKGEKAEQYRKELQTKIVKISLSKQRGPISLRRNQVLDVDKTPDSKETFFSIAPLGDTDIELRNFNFYHMFKIGYSFHSTSFDQIENNKDKYRMAILFTKKDAEDYKFNISPVSSELYFAILNKLMADQDKFLRLGSRDRINVQLMEENVMELKETLVIDTSAREQSVIHIPEYKEKPPFPIKIRLFHQDDIVRFPNHPKGIFEFELMKIGDKPEKDGEDKRLIDVLNVRDISRLQSDLEPSSENAARRNNQESVPKGVSYLHKIEQDFKLTVTSEGNDELLYRNMEKKIDRQLVELEEAEFESYQTDVSVFAEEYFTTGKNIEMKHTISHNNREMSVNSVYKNDVFVLNALKNNVTFIIEDQTQYTNRTAHVSLGVSLTDLKTLTRKSGSEGYYIKEFREAYSGAHIIIRTEDMIGMGPLESAWASGAVDKFAEKLIAAASKRKSDIPKLIVWAATAASVVLNEHKLALGKTIWESLPEWAKERALRFHRKIRPGVSEWIQTDDGRECPNYNVIRDALVLVKGNFIQDKREEINWSAMPDEATQPSDKASYRINMIKNNEDDMDDFSDPSYWMPMPKTEAEAKKRVIEEAGATASLEFAIENWVYAANTERNKWAEVTNHFNHIISKIRRQYPVDATALEALLRRMNGGRGGILNNPYYALTNLDAISQKAIRDALYNEYDAGSDLINDAEKRGDLIESLLKLEGTSDVPVQPGVEVPAEPGVEVPAKPGAEIPAKPGAEIPAKPGVEVPAKPAVPPDTLLPVDKPDEDTSKVPKWVVGLTSVAGGGLVMSGAYWGANALLKSSLGTLARFLRLGVMSTGFVLFPTVAAGMTSAASAALFGTGLVGVLKALGINITKEMLRRALFVEIAGCGTLIIFTTGSATEAIRKAVNSNEGKDILDATARSMAAAGATAVCAAGAGGLAKGGQLGFVHRIRSYDDMVKAAAYTGGGLTAASGATDILQCLMGYCSPQTGSSDAGTGSSPQAQMLVMPDFAISTADGKWSEKTDRKNITLGIDSEGKLSLLPDHTGKNPPGNDQEGKPVEPGNEPKKIPSEPIDDPGNANPPAGGVTEDESFLGSLWASITEYLARYPGRPRG